MTFWKAFCNVYDKKLLLKIKGLFINENYQENSSGVYILGACTETFNTLLINIFT